MLAIVPATITNPVPTHPLSPPLVGRYSPGYRELVLTYTLSVMDSWFPKLMLWIMAANGLVLMAALMKLAEISSD